MSKSDICGIFVSAYDKTTLDTFCKDLREIFPNSSYVCQYLLRHLPFKSIVKREKKNNPGLRLLIVGNTNKDFGTIDDYDQLLKQSDHPFFKCGIADLRAIEEACTGDSVKETITEAFKTAKDLLENDLQELNENF